MYRKLLTMLVAGVVLMVGLNMCSGGPKGDEFTATMIQSDGTQSLESKFLLKGNKYRMEMNQDGQNLVVVVDQDAGKTWVISVDDGRYMEMANQDPVSLMNDPFQGLKYATSIGEAENQGTETVAGMTCDKILISANGEDMMTQWVSQEMNFPVKIVNHVIGGFEMELSNIKSESVAADLFVLPEGLERMPAPGEQRVEVPDWAGDLAEAEFVTPPFSKEMAAGEMVKVKPVAGKMFQATAVNLLDTNMAIVVVPFKNGRPLVSPSMYTMNVSEKGAGATLGSDETPYEADEIVVRLAGGKATVEGEFIETDPGQVVKAGGEYRMQPEAGTKYRTRFVNIGTDEAECTIHFFMGGEEKPESETGPLSFRTFTILPDGRARENTWAPDADEVVVRVVKGEMLIQMYQE